MAFFFMKVLAMTRFRFSLMEKYDYDWRGIMYNPFYIPSSYDPVYIFWD